MPGHGEGARGNSEAERKGKIRILVRDPALTAMQEMAKGGKVQALTEAVNLLERELVKTKTQLEIKVGTVGDDAKRVEVAKRAVTDVGIQQSLNAMIDRLP